MKHSGTALGEIKPTWSDQDEYIVTDLYRTEGTMYARKNIFLNSKRKGFQSPLQNHP